MMTEPAAGRIIKRSTHAAWLIGIALVAVVVAVGFYLIGGRLAPAELTDDQPLSVNVIGTVPRTGYTVQRGYTGRIAARRVSDVGFELAGQAKTVAVDDGDIVAAGAVLAKLDTRRLEVRRAELEAARDQAAAEFRFARDSYQRFAAVYQTNGVSKQTLDERENALRVAEAALARAERALESVQVDLTKSTIIAPFEALVARRMVDEGRVIDAGTPVVRLLERRGPEARIGLPPDQADDLAIGRRLTVTVGGRDLPATVRGRVPVTDRPTRSVELIVEIDAQLGKIRHGDLASIALSRTVDVEGFWLPLSALTESSRGLWACLVAEPAADGIGYRAAVRQLELLHTDGDRAYVTGTLAAGDRVIADGLHRLVAGDPVAPITTQQPLAP